jgi:hypothetical protein
MKAPPITWRVDENRQLFFADSGGIYVGFIAMRSDGSWQWENRAFSGVLRHGRGQTKRLGDAKRTLRLSWERWFRRLPEPTP